MVQVYAKDIWQKLWPSGPLHTCQNWLELAISELQSSSGIDVLPWGLLVILSTMCCCITEHCVVQSVRAAAAASALSSWRQTLLQYHCRPWESGSKAAWALLFLHTLPSGCLSQHSPARPLELSSSGDSSRLVWFSIIKLCASTEANLPIRRSHDGSCVQGSAAWGAETCMHDTTGQSSLPPPKYFLPWQAVSSL